MTAAGAGGSRQAARRALPWVAVAVGLLVVAVLTGQRADRGEPLDPTSGRPLGTLALVRLLERFGAEVDVVQGAPGDRADVAVLLADQLDDPARAELRRWIRSGGVLLVADPSSELAPLIDRPGGGLFELPPDDNRISPQCPLSALGGVGAIDPPALIGFEVPDDATGCFPVGDAHFLVARSVGRGAIVAVAGAGVFVNSEIGRADHAVLATSLLAPRAGIRVAYLEPPLAGGGDKGLFDLISPRVKAGMWQLAGAFAVVALWRARRLGRPVLERHPVQIPGSELVVAVGNLLQQARRREQAATMLRHHLRRTLSERLGLPEGLPAEALATAVADRTGVPAGRVAAALAPVTPPDEAALVELAATIESIRTEVLHA